MSLTQGSGFWDDQSGGDADGAVLFNSPYYSTERALFFSLLMASSAARAYVLSGVDNSFEVVQAGTPGMSVLVRSGKMFYQGYLYANTGDEAITVSGADATNPRMDLIVARITFASQTIRVGILAGTAAATPSRPALTQNTTTYEVALAELWIPASSSTVTDPFIHDLRDYAPNYDAMFTNRGYPENMILNPEVMAAHPTAAPGYTRILTSPSSITGDGAIARASWHRRGCILVANPSAATTESWSTDGIPVQASTVYTIKTSIQAYTGNTSGSEVVIASDGAVPLDIHKKYYRIGVWEECQITFTTPSDATAIAIYWRSLGLAKSTLSGPSMMVRGYYTGPWRQYHETLMFAIPLTDASWNGTAKSTGTTTITLGSAGSYAANIPKGVRALILYMEANDSGSSAGVASLKVSPASTNYQGTILLDGTPDDKVRSEQCILWLTNPVGGAAPTFLATVTASGASTLDATLKIVGMLT